MECGGSSSGSGSMMECGGDSSGGNDYGGVLMIALRGGGGDNMQS